MHNAPKEGFAMITVIGGSGFIGAQLGKRLNGENSHFVIVDKASSAAFSDQLQKADVRSLDVLRQVVPAKSKIVHLAAEHRDDVRPESLYHDVNVIGAENICTVAREKNITSIVFTSTVAVYGFAPAGTDETGRINPFNAYGRSKWEAEQVFKQWQAEEPNQRTLVIVRPTVVFGEQNRGNVYNLLRQIASGRFMMIGDGTNRKSMAYVENITAFLEHALSFAPGVHIHNYVDKPDFDMNTLVSTVRQMLGKGRGVGPRLPFSLGMALGKGCDLIARISGRSLPVSSIRVKKFCATTEFATNIAQTGFIPPVGIQEALERTVRYEFLEDNTGRQVFYTE
jgi:GlcNAc-P-P-Und epimerase